MRFPAVRATEDLVVLPAVQVIADLAIRNAVDPAARRVSLPPSAINA